MKYLSSPQRKILDAIRHLSEHYGYPPSIRELVDDTGLASTSTVHYHLEKLAQLGVIEFAAGKMRTIRIKEGA